MGLSEKIGRILWVILVGMGVIVLRVWHLAAIQKEERREEARRPQRRTVVERAARGVIEDRMGRALASNGLAYRAAIDYRPIGAVPAVAWENGPEGKREKRYPRKEYVKGLAEALAPLVHLTAERIEDLIYAKAALVPHAPFVLAGDLTEEEHYRLRQLERVWPAVIAEVGTKRVYPAGRVGCDVVGTLGAISAKRYEGIVGEMQALQEEVRVFEEGRLPTEVPEEMRRKYERLAELKEKAYTLNDRVGKSGVEGQWEEALRGFLGKRSVEVDHQGRVIRELPGGRAPVSGEAIRLSLSIELQEFAESLLAESEGWREGKSWGLDRRDGKRKALAQPWIKGGAIVAIDPQTGEVLALASYPRFDPADFAAGKGVDRWLENEEWIGKVWDGLTPLLRERYGAKRGFYEDKLPLTWEAFLGFVAPKDDPVALLLSGADVQTAIELQEDFEGLSFYLASSDPLEAMRSIRDPSLLATDAAPYVRRLEARLSGIERDEDRLFAIDLARLAVYGAAWSDPLLEAGAGKVSLRDYRSDAQAVARIEEEVRLEEMERFRREEFAKWREVNQKPFLAAMRAEEKRSGRYARPYLDYLDEKEQELFKAHFAKERLALIGSRLPADAPIRNRVRGDLLIDYLRTFERYHSLERPLLGAYRGLRKGGTLKQLAASFYPKGGFGFGRSLAFQAGLPHGSMFKIVTACAALNREGGRGLKMVDKWDAGGQVVGYGLDGTPYRRMYKGGRLPRSLMADIGEVDLAGALAVSSNPYFAILAGDFLEEPLELNEAAIAFGYGRKTGIDLPGEAKGQLPSDLEGNKTGLYSYAIGQHTLLATPLQAACMLMRVAMRGEGWRPQVAKMSLTAAPNREGLDAFAESRLGLQRELKKLGLDYPLFTALAPQEEAVGRLVEREPIQEEKIPIGERLWREIVEGLDACVWGGKGPRSIRTLRSRPEWMADYMSLEHQMVGKTGTAEVLYNPYPLPSSTPNMYKHIWFGAIAFPENKRWEDPELVVVVMLRFGDAGKEAAPLAAQVIKKWREIRSRERGS